MSVSCSEQSASLNTLSGNLISASIFNQFDSMNFSLELSEKKVCHFIIT
uniref:Uncharacterized protein n=1 Tax=Onchocerca volvulus TaxID=6282 RepID=A0A8R1XY65_ONCVO